MDNLKNVNNYEIVFIEPMEIDNRGNVILKESYNDIINYINNNFKFPVFKNNGPMILFSPLTRCYFSGDDENIFYYVDFGDTRFISNSLNAPLAEARIA